MIAAKANAAKLKTLSFKLSERSSASVYMRLLPETLERTLCLEPKSNPIVPSVNLLFFRAYATYFSYICELLSRQYRAPARAPRAIVGQTMN